MRRIVIFGGSFNPVHNGHVGIARRALEELEPDLLLVVPAASSPFKTGVRQLPAALRLAMAEAAFAGVPKAKVDAREIERGGISYTIDTVREIAKENPGSELVFLAGEDAVADAGKWKCADELKKLCTFRSMPRTPESSTEARRLAAEGGRFDLMMPPAAAKLLEDYLKTSKTAGERQ